MGSNGSDKKQETKNKREKARKAATVLTDGSNGISYMARHWQTTAAAALAR
jgi:hypothetical protein